MEKEGDCAKKMNVIEVYMMNDVSLRASVIVLETEQIKNVRNFLSVEASFF
jgi:hypothetical protein